MRGRSGRGAGGSRAFRCGSGCSLRSGASPVEWHKPRAGRGGAAVHHEPAEAEVEFE